MPERTGSVPTGAAALTAAPPAAASQADNLRLIRGDVMRVGIEKVVEEMQQQARHADSDTVARCAPAWGT